MKLTIDANYLSKILEKLANVISLDGQSSLISGLVKLTVKGGKLFFETNNLNPYICVEIIDDKKVEVEEEGIVIFSCDLLSEWARKQKGSKIRIQYKQLKNSKQVVSNNEGDSEKDTESKLKIIGSLSLSATDDKKVTAKWKIDSYELNKEDEPFFKNINNDNFVFKLDLDMLENVVRRVSSAGLSSDVDHIIDCLCLQPINDELHAIATDKVRCAVEKIKGVQDLALDGKLLIPIAKIKKVAKIMNGESSFFYDGEKGTIIIKNKLECLLLSCPNKEIAKRFPDIKGILSFKVEKLCEFKSENFDKLISSLKMVNPSSLRMNVEKDKDIIEINAVSEIGRAPAKGSCEIGPAIDSFVGVFAVNHFMDFFKSSEEDVELFFNKNLFVLKNKGHEDFRYYTMVIDNPKYKDA